jgi:hypothetical protein
VRAIAKRYSLHQRVGKLEVQSPAHFVVIFLPGCMWATSRLHRATENVRIARNLTADAEVIAGPLVPLSAMAEQSPLSAS